jgi:hypothetical protein
MSVADSAGIVLTKKNMQQGVLRKPKKIDSSFLSELRVIMKDGSKGLKSRAHFQFEKNTCC